jgi:hypothetical protein
MREQQHKFHASGNQDLGPRALNKVRLKGKVELPFFCLKVSIVDLNWSRLSRTDLLKTKTSP